jgi:cytoskeletal protein CcmA (bactofilin family)
VETPKAPDTAHGEMTHIGKSVVIKGELSCSEELYINGQVEGAIDPKGNRLTIGPNGRVKASVKARAVVVQGKLEGDISASDRVDLIDYEEGDVVCPHCGSRELEQRWSAISVLTARKSV